MGISDYKDKIFFFVLLQIKGISWHNFLFLYKKSEKQNKKNRHLCVRGDGIIWVQTSEDYLKLPNIFANIFQFYLNFVYYL